MTTLVDIDKNDVDINLLFSYKHMVELVSPDDSTIFPVYQRLVGDAELNRARVFGLRESAKLRKNLKNKKWEDRLAYLPDVSSESKEFIINMVSIFNTRTFTSKAMREIDLPLPKELSSDASLEEQEEHQKVIDGRKETISELLKKNLKEEIENYKRELKKKTKAELLKLYETELISELAEQEFQKCFNGMCVQLGTYRDSNYSTLLYEDYEDFENAPSQLKEQLIDGYLSLGITTQDLKKSPGAMLSPPSGA